MLPSGHGQAVVLMNSQQLPLSAPDLHKVKPAKITAHMEKVPCWVCFVTVAVAVVVLETRFLCIVLTVLELAL